MFDNRFPFPMPWTTNKKLIWLVGAVVGGVRGVWKTVTGTLIHITDAIASPVRALSVAIEPQQSGSGDPSPDNVRPITGWTGCDIWRTRRNLLNPIIYDGGVYQPTVGSTLNLTKSATQFQTVDNETFTITTSSTWQYYTLLFPIPESGKNYYIYINYTSSGQLGRSAGFLDADKKVLSAINSTSKPSTWQGEMQSSETANASYFYMVLTNSGTASATITVKKPIITRYEDDHTYEPYSGTTYPISWQTEAGTVYGGALDVVNGTLTIDKYFEVFDGSQDESWSKYGTGSAKNFAMKISPAYRLKTPTNSEIIIRSNYLRSITAAATWGNYSNFISAPGVANPAIVTGINTITTVEDWREYLSENPLQVVYTLYSPITYQLTPQEITTLAGENNIWADVNGTITLTYKSDGRDSDKADTGKADFMTLTS